MGERHGRVGDQHAGAGRGDAAARLRRLSARALTEYVVHLIDRRRQDPGDDLLSALIRTSEGNGLAPDELLGTAWPLLTAGYETTAGLVANGALALLLAVEETLRSEGPGEIATSRFTTCPVESGGTVVPGDGQLALCVLADAGRDQERLAEPRRCWTVRPDFRNISFRPRVTVTLRRP